MTYFNEFVPQEADFDTPHDKLDVTRQVRGWSESKVGFILIIYFSQTWSKTFSSL